MPDPIIVTVTAPAPIQVAVTEAVVVLPGGGGGGAVSSVDGRTGAVTLSDMYAAIVHSHAVSNVTGLQAALDAKAPIASPTFTGTVSGVTKSMVGLGNVDNTSDANKPVSSAQQTALNLKQDTSAGLTALIGATTVGSLHRTGLDTYASRTLTGSTNINVTNGDGATGNPTVSITGTVGVANGGTGRATGTTAFGLVAVGTTATGAQQTIGPGTSGQFLKSAGASALGAFATLVAADVSDFNTASDARVNALVPASSETVVGKVELATAAEAVTGSSTSLAVHPSGLTATRGLYVGINAQTGTTYAPVLTDQGKLVTCTNAAAITVTLPANATTAFPIGTQIDFAGMGAGKITFVAGAGATTVGTPSLVTRAQYSAVTAVKTATDAWLIIGDTA